jgi:hypothetical protein
MVSMLSRYNAVQRHRILSAPFYLPETTVFDGPIGVATLPIGQAIDEEK